MPLKDVDANFASNKLASIPRLNDLASLIRETLRLDCAWPLPGNSKKAITSGRGHFMLHAQVQEHFAQVPSQVSELCHLALESLQRQETDIRSCSGLVQSFLKRF